MKKMVFFAFQYFGGYSFTLLHKKQKSVAGIGTLSLEREDYLLFFFVINFSSFFLLIDQIIPF